MEEDEKVLRVFRRPLLFSIPGFALRAAFWLTLIVVGWFFYRTYNDYDLTAVWQAITLLGLVHVFAPMWKWYFNALVMTNESLIIVDWPKLWERRSTRIDFHNLDEITVERSGVKSFLLNYGNLMLAKVNGGGEHAVFGLARPTKTAREIEDYREWHLDKKNFTEESALKGLLSGIVQRHVGDRGQPERERRGARYETTYEPSENRVESHTTERVIERVVPVPTAAGTPAQAARKPFRKKNYDDLPDTEIEKNLDDTGGIDLDLDD